MAYYDQEEILNKTDGGLDIITKLCPDAEHAIQRNRNFKIREENTASASLKQVADGTWIVTDWGDDGKSRNGIQLWQYLNNISFKEALAAVAKEFGIMPEEKLKEVRQPDFDKRPAKPEEKDGEYTFDTYDEIPEPWLKVLGPQVKREKLDLYHFYGVKSYTYCTRRELMTFSSREDYPIFIIEEPGFKKIYQPLAYDKGKRFMYAAKKRPKGFLHGLSQAQKFFYDVNPHEADGYVEDEEAAKKKEENGGRTKTEKLPELVICSGDRDAMNVAGMGYWVIWKNSETATISGEEFKKLTKIATKIYNVPDIDATGIKQGHSLAMSYLELYTVWLPLELRERKDWRRNPRKDLLDFCEINRATAPKKFRGLMEEACCYQFWEYVKLSKGYKYEVDNTHLYNFLMRNGFYRYDIEGEKDEIFIHIQGNVVSEVKPVDIRKFINQFIASKRLDKKLRNTFYRSAQVNASSMENLETADPDFMCYNQDHRFFYFKDKVVRINKEKVHFAKAGTVEKYVWKDNVVDHKLEILDDFFRVHNSTDDKGRQQIEDVEILDDSCLFLRYLILTSRIHWHKELRESLKDQDPVKAEAYREKYRYSIDGPNLNEAEIYEQKLHLVNKMYAIGYLLHRYRNRARTWVPYAMDNHLSESGESHGGSGKSFIFDQAVPTMMRQFYKGARDNRIFDDRHIYDGVTKHTDFVLFDDAGEYFDFNKLFSHVTGKFPVNPKNNKPFSIPFQEAPIITITTNYTLRKTDPSTLRRILFMVFSDYFHKESEFHEEEWTILDEFGKQLLGPDMTEEEMNLFYNTMLQCLKLYLALPGKVDPPMSNVELRNLRTQMGDIFFNWAELFFAPIGGNLNKELTKLDVMEAFQKATKTTDKHITPPSFKKKLKAYCRFHGLFFNAASERKDGRIIRYEHGKTVEKICLQTPDFDGVTDAPDAVEMPPDEEAKF